MWWRTAGRSTRVLLAASIATCERSRNEQSHLVTPPIRITGRSPDVVTGHGNTPRDRVAAPSLAQRVGSVGLPLGCSNTKAKPSIRKNVVLCAGWRARRTRSPELAGLAGRLGGATVEQRGNHSGHTSVARRGRRYDWRSILSILFQGTSRLFSGNPLFHAIRQAAFNEDAALRVLQGAAYSRVLN